MLEILNLIFPELKNIYLLTKLNDLALEILKSKDFVFWLIIMVVDLTDNAEYFLFKYNISNDDKKRLRFIYKYYPNLKNKNFFTEKNIQKLLYFNNKSFVIDLIDLKICNTLKESIKMKKLRDYLIKIEKPIFPIKANNLIDQFNLKEGKELGDKLKKIEQAWVENNFKISNQEVNRIVYN